MATKITLGLVCILFVFKYSTEVWADTCQAINPAKTKQMAAAASATVAASTVGRGGTSKKGPQELPRARPFVAGWVDEKAISHILLETHITRDAGGRIPCVMARCRAS